MSLFPEKQASFKEYMSNIQECNHHLEIYKEHIRDKSKKAEDINNSWRKLKYLIKTITEKFYWRTK